MKKPKISHSTFDRKINLIYFVPFAQWENESDSTGSNLWHLRNDGKEENKKRKERENNKKISKVNKNEVEVEEPRFQMDENVTELVLVTLRNGVEEGKRFSNEEKDPMTSKELNGEPYEMKISCTVL